jgi:Xaa-Pro aminopeptidase
VSLDFSALASAHQAWIDRPGYGLTPDFPLQEYLVRLRRARALMVEHDLDALVITSSGVGSWFTSALEPHEWHDKCSARSAWYILTASRDVLYMTPTTGGEHFNTTRRSIWVSEIRGIAERACWPRRELWDLAQVADWFSELGVDKARLGFELGDGMTLGLAVYDFLKLQGLLPRATIVDGSDVVRRLMSIHTPLEIERLRRACSVGVAMHDLVPQVLRVGMTERGLAQTLAQRFEAEFGGLGYAYRMDGAWDVRNPDRPLDDNCYHIELTDRSYAVGDLVCRGTSGVSYRGYAADVDRIWHVGEPSPEVRRLYAMTWEATRAMAEQIKPGCTCADVYRASLSVERRHGFPERVAGRIGHGYRNTGGLSVHPDNETVLEPGMILSVEPMYATMHGFFVLEDQYLVTEAGAEPLHPLAAQSLPIVPA